MKRRLNTSFLLGIGKNKAKKNKKQKTNQKQTKKQNKKNKTKKQQQKTNKNQNKTKQNKKQLWNMKVTFIPIAIGALGTFTKGLLKRLEDLEIRGRAETI